ncbi:hypothetical protein BM1_02074 [Bipolaris maydis]|nr:hypothetical protein BM1_02074 [Bipolaris maydis]
MSLLSVVAVRLATWQHRRSQYQTLTDDDFAQAFALTQIPRGGQEACGKTLSNLGNPGQRRRLQLDEYDRRQPRHGWA